MFKRNLKIPNAKDCILTLMIECVNFDLLSESFLLFLYSKIPRRKCLTREGKYVDGNKIRLIDDSLKNMGINNEYCFVFVGHSCHAYNK